GGRRHRAVGDLGRGTRRRRARRDARCPGRDGACEGVCRTRRIAPHPGAGVSLPRGGPDFMLQGKIAIVTGSTSGIGLGIAAALAAQGCNIMLNGFGDAAAIADVRQRLAERHRVRVAYSPADMSKPAGVREMVKATVEEWGGVDILVNNAGIQHVAKVVDFPEDRWDAVIAIN